MKIGKQQILKILSAIGLFGVITLLCFTNGYSAISTTSISTSYSDGLSHSSIYGGGYATHNTRNWQELDGNAPDPDQFGVSWSINGGGFGNEDLYVGNSVVFKFNMHKANIGTHFADHLKAWVDWDKNGYGSSDQIAYLERKLTDHETVSTNPSTSYTPPDNPDFSFTSEAFQIGSSHLDGLYLRARVTCSESLLSRYYSENNMSNYFSDDDQFEWNTRDLTDTWRTTYENMFAATGLYGQGEVEEWLIAVKSPPGGNEVPEPATMILYGFGLLGLARIARKGKQI